MAQPEYGTIYCSGLASDAVAATTMVYAIAPFFSRFSTKDATVERFCPMAT